MSLGSVWHIATDVQREKLIKDISMSLKTINTLDPAVLDSPHATLSERIENKLTDFAEQLYSNKTISAQTVDKIRQKATAAHTYFDDTFLHPVYYDIHFDNFIVNDIYALQAVINLENVELAALDYPLFVLQKMTDEPHKYLSEHDEQFADKKDYLKLIPWYKKYYPEMFGYENLTKRLEYYQLLDTLNLILDWPKTEELHKNLAELVKT